MKRILTNDFVETSATKDARRPNARGFTLIEVMIAVLIVGVGMVAILQALSQYVVAQSEIEQKLVATWVASNALENARYDAKVERVKTGRQNTREEMGGVDWRVSSTVTETEVEDVYLITVEVSVADDRSDRVLASVVSAIGEVR